MPSAPAAPAPTQTPTAPAKPSAPAQAPVAVPAPAAKVTSPFDDSFARLDQFADPEESDSPSTTEAKAKAKSPPPASAKPVAKPKATEPAADPEEEGTVEDPEAEETSETPEQTEEQKPQETKKEPVKPQRESPWKLVDSYKAKNAQLQKEIAELRTGRTDGELPKEAAEKFTALETRNKELEEEIRHYNYTKSQDYIDNYQKPFEQAWARAIEDIKQLTVPTEDGGNRAATSRDLLALANMPLGQASTMAKEWFGDAANDMMAHRRQLLELSDKQTKAQEDARKNGAEREQKLSAEQQAKAKARFEEHLKVWNAVNAEAVEKYEYLRPVEGETERNERLEKATKFVDQTLRANAHNAKTHEERDQIIRDHAAVRNRAIGFSPLKHENTTLRAKVAALEKSLAEFQGSEPGNGEPKDRSQKAVFADPMEEAMAGLMKYSESE